MTQPSGRQVPFNTPHVRRGVRLPNPKRVKAYCSCAAVLVALLTPCFGQAPAEEERPAQPRHRRLLGIIPSYGTYPSLKEYKPISSDEKFRMARRSSFDVGPVLLAAALAGWSQWGDEYPSFGQGTKGYARYLGTAYADVVIGHYLRQAIYPSLLHQDPRYFQSGSGSRWARLGNAVGQVYRARADSGRWQFNYSAMAGSATAVAISTAYYPEDRSARDAAARFGVQMGIDMGVNVLKEFWPDVSRKLFGGRGKRATPDVNRSLTVAAQ